MKRQTLIAFGLAALIGAALGVSCSYPQPGFECSLQAVPYWAKYTLRDAGSGDCGKYVGDWVEMQRYYPPGADTATFAILPSRVAVVTRAGRSDPSDPNYQKESARGTFTSLTPDSKGVCTTSAFAPTDQSLAAVDGGDPATHIKYEWSNFRLLNNATYVSTVFTADLAVTLDSCQATYQVDALAPIVTCDTDDDCCHLDATGFCGAPPGQSVGSGLQSGYEPKCFHFTDRLGYESQVLASEVPKWEADTAYAKGDMVYNDVPPRVYEANNKGKSGAADAGATGPMGTDGGIADGDPSDGGLTWEYVNDGPRHLTTTGVCVPSKSFDSLLK